MCGRFTLRTPRDGVAAHFDLPDCPELASRYNAAPGQEIATVREVEGTRRLELRRWGLVPHWAGDPRMGSRLINARAETLATRPAFRSAFRRGRCAIPADGFFEWSGTERQPHLIELDGGALFAMAGLAEAWVGPGGEVIESCAIVTTEPSPEVARLHDRMPAILDGEALAAWLSPEERAPEALLALLAPRGAGRIRVTPVSRRVNRVDADDPRCVEPVRPVVQGELFS